MCKEQVNFELIFNPLRPDSRVWSNTLKDIAWHQQRNDVFVGSNLKGLMYMYGFMKVYLYVYV